MAAPTPTAVGGGDETPSKKLKTEWDDTRDTEPTKAQVEAEAIKTTGQAEKFYSDITQILELSNTTSTLLPLDLQETLAQLVKTVGPAADIPESALGRSASGNRGGPAGTGTGVGGGGEPQLEANNFLVSFLDFLTFDRNSRRLSSSALVDEPSPEAECSPLGFAPPRA